MLKTSSQAIEESDHSVAHPFKALDWPAIPPCADKLSVPFMREHTVFPISENDQALVVAMEDITDVYAIHAVKLATQRVVIATAAPGDEVQAAIERWSRARTRQPDDENFGSALDASEIDPIAQPLTRDDIDHLKDLALETPVVQFVNGLLNDAIYARATDIHIEPFEHRLVIRIRVDGLLREIPGAAPGMERAVVSRLKILSGLDIAERRLPQDGRSRVRIAGRQIDMRVATIPTVRGEAMAIRLLDNVRRTLDFATLGFSPDNIATLERQLAQPYGMVLVTGPTGSGKTTTLATALAKLNDRTRKILTVEDPIEYELEGINQTQVKPSIGLTFASALRSFLRHDPDVIMVGEMRDAETAGIGVHAALTGHIVLSTLHTNTAAGAVARLLDMGIDGYLLASSLRCIVGQRLVRTLCIACRKPDKLPPDVAPDILAAVEPPDGTQPVFWKAVGCPRCFGSGYAERTVIAETLVVDDTIRDLMRPGVARGDLERAATARGMVPMWRHGISKCLAGMTTYDEVRRVVVAD